MLPFRAPLVLSPIFRRVYPIGHLYACCVHISCLQNVPRYLMSSNQPEVAGMMLYSSSSQVPEKS
jgi:hypothetical protein